jgi:ferredoxin
MVRVRRLHRQVHRLRPVHGRLQEREQRSQGAVLRADLGGAVHHPEERPDDRQGDLPRRRGDTRVGVRQDDPALLLRPEALQPVRKPRLRPGVPRRGDVPDGVVLVNEKTCIGCRYCIQACPYGARYLHPKTHTADKCTFCYHRVSRGQLPACVEVCPTQTRIFGDLNAAASPMSRFLRMNKIHTLKPGLNTEPKVFYANLDGEVR